MTNFTLTLFGKTYYVTKKQWLIALIPVLCFCFALIWFTIAAIYFTGDAIGIGGYWALTIAFLLTFTCTIDGTPYQIIPNENVKKFITGFIATGSLVFYILMQLQSF